MTKDNSFAEYIRDLLEPFGTIKIKAMFGGYGIYCNDVFFAILVENELYFKGDKGEVSDFFRANGSERFTYNAKGKNVAMEYWKVLDEVLEDDESLSKWFNMSYNLALNKKKK